MDAQLMREVKKQFKEEFNHLWHPYCDGGINGVGFSGDYENPTLNVYFVSNKFLNQVPDIYRTIKVFKSVIGDITAYNV